MAFRFKAQSVSTVNFLDALVTNAKSDADLVLPGALAGMNGNARGRLKSITILSVENLDWEIQLYRKDAFTGASIDVDSFTARWSFVAADAVRVAGAGNYLYYIDGLDHEYVDEDNSGELHVRLINRSVASKTANAGGAIVVKFYLEPSMVY
jgi:hypothetical protein